MDNIVTNKTIGFWGALHDNNGNSTKCLAVPVDDGFHLLILVEWATGGLLDFLLSRAPDNTGFVEIFCKAESVTCDETPIEIEYSRKIPKRYVDFPEAESFPIIKVNGKVVFGTAQATIHELEIRAT